MCLDTRPVRGVTNIESVTSLGILTGTMTPQIDTDKLVTVPEAAKLLNVTPAAVHKAIKRGRLPYLKLGGVFLIQRADLIQYQKSKSVGGRPKKQS